MECYQELIIHVKFINREEQRRIARASHYDDLRSEALLANKYCEIFTHCTNEQLTALFQLVQPITITHVLRKYKLSVQYYEILEVSYAIVQPKYCTYDA